MKSRRRDRCAAAGASLIEVLVAMTISSLCLAAVYGSLIVQARRHAAQAGMAETLHASRLAFETLTKQITNAGFGIPQPTSPSAAASIVAATPTRFTFWTNTGTHHSYLRTAVAAGGRTVSVVSADGIENGNSVYIADDNRWAVGTVQSVSGTSLQLAAGLASGFAAGSLVLPVEQVTFSLADGVLERNGHPLIRNVTDLRFTYDSTTLAAIRVITVGLTVKGRVPDVGGTHRSITLGARIAPPNLAL